MTLVRFCKEVAQSLVLRTAKREVGGSSLTLGTDDRSTLHMGERRRQSAKGMSYLESMKTFRFIRPHV